jgi:carbonic anhydrase
MSKILDEVLAANLNYSRSFGEKAQLGLPPARRFAILTCMDARLDPAKYAGLAEGDAHVIRNAGGRATEDAIRSLVISYKLLGTREWFVIHHTDCGMELCTDDVIAELLENSVATAVFERNQWKDVGQGPGSIAGRYIKWTTSSRSAPTTSFRAISPSTATFTTCGRAVCLRFAKRRVPVAPSMRRCTRPDRTLLPRSWD